MDKFCSDWGSDLDSVMIPISKPVPETKDWRASPKISWGLLVGGSGVALDKMFSSQRFYRTKTNFAL